MPASSRSRNQPCFCGSGRKLKHCCARQLTIARTWNSEATRCRWRFWTPHTPTGRYASELAEHICTGERAWIARDTPDGTSWMIDNDTVTLLEILDHLPGAHYHWVIAQTMTALHDAAPTDDINNADEDPDTPVLGELHGLMLEVLKLAHASDELTAQLPLKTTPLGTPGLQLRDRTWIQLAS
jgi:SEC-C motif